MNKIIEFLVKSNIFLAVWASLISMSFAPYAKTTFLWGALVYLLVFTLYTTHRLIKWNFVQLDNEWQDWYSATRRVLIPLVIVHFLGTCYMLFFWLQVKWSSTLIIILLLTLWYLIPNSLLSLRRIPFLKAIIVALVWTYVLILLPHQQLEKYPSEWFWRLGFFFYFLHLAILSDIKDINLDPIEWKTIPSVLGIRTAKWVSLVFALLAFSFFVLSPLTQNSFWIGVLYLSSWYFLERKSVAESNSYDKLLLVLTILFLMIRVL